MSERYMFIDVGKHQIESAIFVPTKKAKGCVVICHPHPLYGGDMHNNVVVGLQNSLEERGFATLRYNFRGVGESGGTAGDLSGDIEDLNEIVTHLKGIEALKGLPLAVVGYSYGTIIALSAGSYASALVAVAPPIAMFDMKFLSQINSPLLVIVGSKDPFCPQDKIRKLIPSNARFEVIVGADHFFVGAEYKAGAMTAEFLENTF